MPHHGCGLLALGAAEGAALGGVALAAGFLQRDSLPAETRSRRTRSAILTAAAAAIAIAAWYVSDVLWQRIQ